MPRLCKALPRCLLLPPVFFATAVCLWMASTVFPNAIFHVCVSAHRKQLYCFRSQSFGLTNLGKDDVSTRISNVHLKPSSLVLDDAQGTTSPNKPVKDVEQLEQREELNWFANPANASGTIEQEDTPEDRDDFEVRSEQNDLSVDRSQEPLGPELHQQEISRHAHNETQLLSTADDGGENLHDRVSPSDREEVQHLLKKSTNLATVRHDESELQYDRADGSMVLAEQGDRSGYQSSITASIVPNKSRKVKHLDMAVPPTAETANLRSSDSRANGSVDQLQIRNVNLPDQKTTSGNNSVAWSIPLHDEVEKKLVHLMETMRKSATPPNDSGNDGAGWILRKKFTSDCGGRKVYIYDLPSKFNTDLLTGCDDILPWSDMCQYVVNSGMGEQIRENTTISGGETVLVPAGRWYATNQYALEMMFHARMQEDECRTFDPEQASAFYVPFYGGMDVLRWHFRENTTNERKDELSLELIRWLEEQEWWQRRSGNDHLLVLGKIAWDFRRSGTDRWGSSLLQMTETQNVTKLLIERHPWEANDIGVPHTTFFHPANDGDIKLWQQKIDETRRTHLVSFAGMPRPGQSGSIRSALIQQCENNSTACLFLRCSGDVCQHPENPVSVFTHSEFCLQPPGDSPTRRSIFDSLIAGCVPVLFNLYSAYFQYPWHLPADPATYSVFIPQEDVIRERNPVNVVDLLQRIPPAVRADMRRTIIYDIMPGLLYAAPGARLTEFNDAFDIALDRILWRVTNKLRTFAASSKV